MAELEKGAVLQIENLSKQYEVKKLFAPNRGMVVRAVDDISFSVYQGEVFGIVGESGCGKTTTARMICRAIDPTSGSIIFDAKEHGIVDLAAMSEKELIPVRRHVQMIFQDPHSSLSPRMSVYNIIAEPLSATKMTKAETKDRVTELMEMVGLDPAFMVRYAHAFSGGQRQRIGIARAMALAPSLVLADEPVSALDVSVQAQILNLMIDLREKTKVTYVFIGHDLGVIRYVCDRVAIMYMGKIVELATGSDIFSAPAHPYTQMLLKSVPDADPHQPWVDELEVSELPDATKRIEGCAFAPRCPRACARCREETPALTACGGEGRSRHLAACFDVNNQATEE